MAYEDNYSEHPRGFSFRTQEEREAEEMKQCRREDYEKMTQEIEEAKAQERNQWAEDPYAPLPGGLTWIKDPIDTEDMVNHPPHYGSQDNSDIECLDAIRASCTREEYTGYLKGQLFKYSWRAGRKIDALEDAKKVEFYTKELIKTLEGKYYGEKKA